MSNVTENTETRPQAVVFDLDGVLLHYDPERLSAIAARHGLEPAALTTAAFGPDVLRPLVTGRLSHGDWVRHVGAAVGCLEAAETWLDGTADVDDAVLALIAELRAAGVRTAILTNGTDRTLDLLEARVPAAVDVVVCTALLGVAKPDREAYHHTCAQLGVAPADTFFVDDTAANVDGARRAGLDAELYAGVDALRTSLVTRGLLEGP